VAGEIWGRLAQCPCDLLPELFDDVFVPRAVWDEIMAGEEDDIARAELPNLSWITRVPVSESNPPVEASDLGRGETETISLALKLETSAFW
jgi:predicted nucleic acid-binding protein